MKKEEMIKLAKEKNLYLRFGKSEDLIKSVLYVKENFKLVYQGYVYPENYTYEDIINLTKYNQWSLENGNCHHKNWLEEDISPSY